MERKNTAAVTGSAPAVPLVAYIEALRRRRWAACITAGTLTLLAIVVGMFWPATYRSTGTILIEQQEVPVDLVRSMISSYADQRIQMITQRVMTTENLWGIVQRYDLYRDERRTQPREIIIEQMREDIGFRMISADVVDPRLGRPTKATIAFAVSYDSPSAQLAAKVANELTTLYLNENLASRKQLTDNTTSFLTAEAERLSQQIAGLDGKIASFKQQHANSLPELTGMNLQLMTRVEEEMRETDTRIRSLDQQIVFLDAQLAQLDPAGQVMTSSGQRILSPADRLKMLRSEYARAVAVYAPDHPDVVRTKREMEGLEREVGRVDTANDLARQLREAEGQLAQARERYAPDHPDVQRLERLVASVSELMKEAPLTAAATSAEADNPAYIQVNSQRTAAQNERAALEQKRDELRARLADFEGRLARSPDVEREYGALVRDLDGAQVKYREVRQKQMEANLAASLENERKGERFTLIEPPFVSGEPVSPNRPLILVLGAILAISGAAGTVVMLEALDPSIHARRDVEALLSVPPLAVVPFIVTPAERATRARWRRYSLAGASASVVSAVALTHFLYRPLDVLWEVALRRLFG